MNSNKKKSTSNPQKAVVPESPGWWQVFLWFGLGKRRCFHLSSALPFLCPSQEKWLQNPSPWRSLRMLFLIRPRLMSLLWVSNQRFLAQKGKSGASSSQGVVWVEAYGPTWRKVWRARRDKGKKSLFYKLSAYSLCSVDGIIQTYAQLKSEMRDCPSGPVVKTTCIHCRGPGFDPCPGN